MTTLELARPEELDACAALMEEGREFQRSQGFVQWTPDYPNRDTVREDIGRGKGYVLKVDGRLAGYLCVDFDGEPAYKDIQDGQWETGEPYAVVHRMALGSAFRGQGLTGAAFRLVGELCRARGVDAIRGDTDPQTCGCSMCWRKTAFSAGGPSCSRAARSWPMTSP